MSQTTNITVNFRGTPTVVKYCSHGGHYPGYASSLRQLRKHLYTTFGVRRVELYCIANRQRHVLTSDASIRRAIRASGGDSLLVTAYDPQHTQYNAVEPPPIQLPINTPQQTAHAQPSSKAILSHFGVTNYDCHYCKRSQISGVRYKYIGTSSCHSVCNSCYLCLEPRDKQKCYMRIMRWKGDAPAAPLHKKEIDSIRHLQYLLVKLGYLQLASSTSISKTEEAVTRFRQKYHIVSHDMKKYDSTTARKLAQVVRKSRADGRKYI